MEKKKKLKPIVYTSNYFKRGSQNTTQQIMLLKALQVTQDPKKLKQMIGVKKVAEVYQTLDKMAMRKDFHEALAQTGISFNYILTGIKDIADQGEKDADRLKAFQTLLKSTGMDEYKDSAETSGGTWEDVLLEKFNQAKETGNDMSELTHLEEYEVEVPQIPESARSRIIEEEKLTSTIYKEEPAKEPDPIYERAERRDTEKNS